MRRTKPAPVELNACVAVALVWRWTYLRQPPLPFDPPPPASTCGHPHRIATHRGVNVVAGWVQYLLGELPECELSGGRRRLPRRRDVLGARETSEVRERLARLARRTARRVHRREVADAL